MLANNAGISMWSTLEELNDLDVIERVMGVNYFGSVYCTYFALKHLKEVAAAAGRKQPVELTSNITVQVDKEVLARTVVKQMQHDKDKNFTPSDLNFTPSW